MPRPMLRIGTLPPLQISPGTLVTVLLIAAVLFPSLQRPGLPVGASALIALGLGLFLILSVLVHELSHALVARLFGARIDHIALTLWGGHTQYRAERMPALGSVLVSLAGPASNAALAGLTAAVAALAAPEGVLGAVASFATWLNVVLALFNLLPGLPMDGGRALESLLGAVLRRPTAGTRITAWIGRAIAVGVLLVPLVRIMRSGGAGTVGLLTLVWALLIAGLLWQGATRALAGARTQDRVDALDVSAVLRSVRLLPPQAPLSALEGAQAPGAHDEQVLLLDRVDPRPGTVGRALLPAPEAIAAVPAAQRGSTTASAVARPLGDVVALRTGLAGEELVSAMLSRPAPVYLVVGADGTPAGVILSADVNDLLRGR